MKPGPVARDHHETKLLANRSPSGGGEDETKLKVGADHAPRGGGMDEMRPGKNRNPSGTDKVKLEANTQQGTQMSPPVTRAAEQAGWRGILAMRQVTQTVGCRW